MVHEWTLLFKNKNLCLIVDTVIELTV